MDDSLFLVVKNVVEEFKQRYTQLNVAGFRNGYYSEDEESGIAEMLRDSRADMLFVGFSSPKKEMFLNRWMPIMKVPFCMGVGGGFDIIAGRKKRAPAWMQKSGLEWCYRIYQEPRRMWKRYAKTNPVFVIHRLRRLHGLDNSALKSTLNAGRRRRAPQLKENELLLISAQGLSAVSVADCFR